MPQAPPEVVIASAVRTPIGKFNGALKGLKAPELGAKALEAALQRANGLDPAKVDDVLMGHVLQAGVGQNPARQAALAAGFPTTIPATTINKVCGSSLKAVMLAAQSIKAGDARVVVAGGQESMTNAPYLLPKARDGYRLGNGEIVDALIHDGLWDVYNAFHMGVTGEVVAEEFGITREAADQLAEASHQKAQQATENGWFKDEIVPVEAPVKRKETTLVTDDEGIRPDTTAEGLGKLKPVFKQDGMVTAGNASQISDGASAVVVASREAAEELGLPVLATVRGYGASGVDPERVMAAPIPGVKALLEKEGLTIDDIDLFEHNEAFATASCAVRGECAVPDDRFNVAGGAIALGHPIGASGTRVLTTLVHGLHRTQKHRGLATLCLGGGNAVQMVVERQ